MADPVSGALAAAPLVESIGSWGSLATAGVFATALAVILFRRMPRPTPDSVVSLGNAETVSLLTPNQISH